MEIGNWVTMAVAVIIGVIALNFASHAVDPNIYDLGLVVFVAAIAFVFLMIKRFFDAADRRRH